MANDPALAVRWAAFTLAQNAKIDAVTQADVDALRCMAERALSHDDMVRRAVTRFATQYELHWAAPVELAAMGCDLADAIDRANVPVPPGQRRSDIHG